MTLVIISSVYTWFNTPIKTRQPNEEEKIEEDSEREMLEKERNEKIEEIGNKLQELKDNLKNEEKDDEYIEKEEEKFKYNNPDPPAVKLDKIYRAPYDETE